MEDPTPDRIGRAIEPWLAVDRQAVILLGVGFLFALWLSGTFEPFILGLPSYLIYFLLHTPLEAVGLVGIEGSPTIFWTSAFLWLYLFSAGMLYVAIKIDSLIGE